MNIKPTSKSTQLSLSEIWAELNNLPRITNYALLKHHAQQALRSVAFAPFTFFVTAISAALTLFVFGLFIFLIENIAASFEHSRTGLSMSIYLRDQVSAEQIESLKAELLEENQVERVEFLSKQQALEVFRRGLAADALVLFGLEEQNPLPASFEVSLKNSELAIEAFEHLAARYGKMPIVERVEYGKGMLLEFASMLKLFRVVGGCAILFLLLTTTIIITNTIRLALHAHREEVEIMKLVGATDSFVKMPYVIEGSTQGLIGALLAIALLYLCYLMLAQALTYSEFLRLLFPSFSFLSIPSIFLIALAGLAIGCLGSYVALRRYLHV